MRITVTNARAIHQERVIEHIAITLWQLFKFVDEIRELLKVILINLVQTCQFCWRVLVMRQWMM